jgi:uroporphyrinogen-III synthase
LFTEKEKSVLAKNLWQTLLRYSKNTMTKSILPCSDVLTDETARVLNTAGIDWTKAVMYRTVASDLSDININEYDMLVFFSSRNKISFSKFPKI